MSRILREISYNFPANHPSPFDKDFEGNYFVYANGFSNLGIAKEEFTFENFVKHIPTGYKTIFVNHRELLTANGKVLKEWNFDSPQLSNVQQQSPTKYLLYAKQLHKNYIVEWDRSIVSNLIRPPHSKSFDLNSLVWLDKKKCADHGLEFSATNQGMVLMARLLEAIHWH